MAIGIIIGIVLVILTIGAFAVSYFAFEDCNDVRGGILLAVGIWLAISFIIVPFSFHTIETGEIAVVKRLGEISGTKEAGTHYSFWMTNKYVKYDTKVRNLESVTAAYSSDAQTMDINMTIQYQIMSDKVIDIATQYGSIDVLENRVMSIATEKTKSVLSAHKAMDIIASRATISPAVEQAIKDAVGDEYFVNIVAVVVTDIDFSDAFELAVEEKMIAEQAKLKAEYENEKKVAQAEAEAEAKLKATQAEIEIAQAQAEAKLKAAQAEIEIAKAEAEALKIASTAEAEANEILDASLTDRIIQKILADSWNGELPEYVGGNGESVLIGMNNN